MEVNTVGAKRKRVSKKTKKSWRKHCDVRDVEEFIEDERAQKQTGGLAAEKTNAQLFFFDTQTIPEGDNATDVTVKKRRREPKALKCHAVLTPDPLITPARKCHNEQPKKSIKACESRKQTAKSADNARNVSLEKHNGSEVYDLWGESGNLSLPANTDEHFAVICKKKRVKPPSHYGQKPSSLPAVEVPAPGASYRPTEEDHKDLLLKAVDVEKKRIRAEQRLQRSLPKAAAVPDEDAWLREWEATTLASDDVSETVIDENDPQAPGLSNNPPVRRENKKTERERRQMKAIKAMEQEAEKKKEDKVRANEMFRLKNIKKEVMRRELALAARNARKQLDKETNSGLKTRKLGRTKFETPSLELKLSTELPNSLRLLKPEGNLVVDRFRSLQKRNIIEPRKRAKVVMKYKPKAFEKKSHQLK